MLVRFASVYRLLYWFGKKWVIATGIAEKQYPIVFLLDGYKICERYFSLRAIANIIYRTQINANRKLCISVLPCFLQAFFSVKNPLMDY